MSATPTAIRRHPQQAAGSLRGLPSEQDSDADRELEGELVGVLAELESMRVQLGEAKSLDEILAIQAEMARALAEQVERTVPGGAGYGAAGEAHSTFIHHRSHLLNGSTVRGFLFRRGAEEKASKERRREHMRAAFSAWLECLEGYLGSLNSAFVSESVSESFSETASLLVSEIRDLRLSVRD